MNKLVLLLFLVFLQFSVHSEDKKWLYANNIKKIFAMNDPQGFTIQAEFQKLEKDFEDPLAFEAFYEEYEKADKKPNLTHIGAADFFLGQKPVQGRKLFMRIFESEKIPYTRKISIIFHLNGFDPIYGENDYWIPRNTLFNILEKCLENESVLVEWTPVTADSVNGIRSGKTVIITYQSFALEYLGAKTVEEAKTKMTAILKNEKESQELLARIDIAKLTPKEIDEILIKWKKLKGIDKTFPFGDFEALATKFLEESTKNVDGKHYKSLVKIAEHLVPFFDIPVELPQNDYLRGIDDCKKWLIYYLKEYLEVMRLKSNDYDFRGQLAIIRRLIEGYQLPPDFFKQ